MILNKEIDLEKLPRIRLGCLPTPLMELTSLNKELKGSSVFMKRDDMTGHCFGGNKERKLEYIMAQAIKEEATVIVTIGVLQSNHCRLTTAVSNKLGLKTELILIKKEEDGKGREEGNYFLNKLMGAKIHITYVDEAGEKIDEVMNALENKGEKPYFIKGGGHNVQGCMGYVQAVKEIKNQCLELGITPDSIVLPTGTATTQAGLVLGARVYDFKVEIAGISISREKDHCVEEINKVLKETEDLLGLENIPYDPYIKVYDEYIGNGYGIPTQDGERALKKIAKREGIAIDPVYNAKAVAGMFDLISKGRLKGNIIYLNTGGLPALFTEKYINWEG